MRRQLTFLSLVIGLAISPVLAQSLFSPVRNDFETGFTAAGSFTGAGTRVATGDLNGDNHLDAIVTMEVGASVMFDPNTGIPAESEGVAVFLGDGRGLFQRLAVYPLPFEAFAGDVVTGDFNGDGNLDGAVAVEDIDGSAGPEVVGGVYIGLGDGTGNLDSDPNYILTAGPVEAGLTGIAAAELNGDNRDDLVVINSAANSFTVFLSGGGDSWTQTSYDTSCNNPVALDLGALDQVAGLDLAVACDPISGADQLQTWRNVGSGSFLPFLNSQPAPSTLNDPRAVRIADLNNDGFNDLAVANSFLSAPQPGGSVTLMRNDGSGGFSTDEFTASGVPVGETPRSIDVGDVDGDGDNDLLLANWDTQDLSVMEADLTGSGFNTQPSYLETFFPAGFQPFDAVWADINGDGTPDVMAANGNESTGTLSAYLGGGDDLVNRALRYAPGGSIELPNAMAVADFNNDDADDFALANAFSDTVTIFRSTANDASPTEPFAVLQTLNFNLDSLPFDVLAADLDSDSDSDLLVLLSPNTGNGTVQVFTNNGSGTFSSGPSYTTGQLPWTMLLADFDGANGDDLAVSNLLDHTVSVFRATGAGQAAFAAEGSFASTNPNTATTCSTSDLNDPQDRDCLPTGLGASDFDNDGNMDLVVSNFGDVFSGGNLQVFSGDGAFSFTHATELETADPNFPADAVNHQTLRVADLDGVNGDDIVAIGLAPNDYVSVYLNDGPSNLTFTAGPDTPFLLPGFDVASPEAPRNTLLQDLNGDDEIDLAVSGIATNNVAVLSGNGDGTFNSDDFRTQGFGTVKEPNAIGVGDFDGDGLLDLLAAGARTDDVSLSSSGSQRRADMDGSGRVDGWDLAAFGRLFGTSKGDPAYDFYLDINMDGTIDGLDQAVLAMSFGQVF